MSISSNIFLSPSLFLMTRSCCSWNSRHERWKETKGPIRSLIHQIDRRLVPGVYFLLFHPLYFKKAPAMSPLLFIHSVKEITHSLLNISHQDNFYSFQLIVSLFLNFMLLLSATFCRPFSSTHSASAHASLFIL